MDDEETTVEENEEEVEEEEAEEPAPETEEPKEPEKPKNFDELKIVINSRGKNYMVGVQSPGCDPVYETFKGTLAAALKRVPKIVETAKKQWAESPTYPKADLPEPPAPQPAATKSTSKRSKNSTPKADDKQPSFF